MKMLILGGCGFYGSSIARDLIKSDEVTQIKLADINLDMTKVAESVRKSEKVSVEYVDITKSYPDLVKMVRGHHIVINAVGPYPRFGTIAVRAAIDARVNYLDICDECSVSREMFELHGSAEEAGVTVCTGMGWTPGLTNMLAKHAADKLDAVEEIEIFFISALVDPIGKAALEQAMGQFIGGVTQYIDGNLVEVPGGSEGEEVRFLEPLGKAEVYYARHPEPFTLPRYIPGVKRVVHKATFTPPSVPKLFKEFVDLGLFDTEPIVVGDTPIKPRDFITSFVQQRPALRVGTDLGASGATNVVVKGQEGNRPVVYVCRFSGWGGPLVAFPASIGARMLCRGEVLSKGVLAPEGAFDHQQFLAELAEKGLHFVEEKKVGD